MELSTRICAKQGLPPAPVAYGCHDPDPTMEKLPALAPPLAHPIWAHEFHARTIAKGSAQRQRATALAPNTLPTGVHAILLMRIAFASVRHSGDPLHTRVPSEGVSEVKQPKARSVLGWGTAWEVNVQGAPCAFCGTCPLTPQLMGEPHTHTHTHTPTHTHHTHGHTRSVKNPANQPGGGTKVCTPEVPPHGKVGLKTN